VATVFQLREVMEQQTPPPSIRQVAREGELAYNTVFAIYHNKAARVDLATLDTLAGVLGCEPGELIGRQGRKKQAGGGRKPKGA
jgi:DNA-binding Xre family transcriptional regulator